MILTHCQYPVVQLLHKTLFCGIGKIAQQAEHLPFTLIEQGLIPAIPHGSLRQDLEVLIIPSLGSGEFMSLSGSLEGQSEALLGQSIPD